MYSKKQLLSILQWDIRAWSKALYFWDKQVDWNSVKLCLELGSREGGLSLWLAQKGKQTICSDYGDVKLTAEPLHIKHNVTAYINYENIDATNIPYNNHFDVIVFKSIIGGIGAPDNFEKQKAVFKSIHKALKPGGQLIFAENLIASKLHQMLRRHFIEWGQSWRYISMAETKQLLQDFSTSEIKTTGFMATFGRNENQRNFLSILDRLFFNHILPDRMKYIVYGVAKK
jgi:2-polyprenyl-3-methyl-5-hydroxy-6-metoxy-1,4-benzoquinol methylase